MKVDVALHYTPSDATTPVAYYFMLVRPRLAGLVLVTASVGWFLGTNREPNWLSLVTTLIGTALLFAGASALNQLLNPHGSRIGTHMVGFTLMLIAASLLPCILGMGGWFSGIGALVLGAIFLGRTFVFARLGTTDEARRVLRMSLVFLPTQLLLLVLDVFLKRTSDY